MPEVEPQAARFTGEGELEIRWNDGRVDHYPPDLLRARCPCAACVDEWTGEVRVRRSDFPDAEIRELEEVGRYAFRIRWNDGHELGLYTWKLLRSIGEEVRRTLE